jgi:hypothetical protein
LEHFASGGSHLHSVFAPQSLTEDYANACRSASLATSAEAGVGQATLSGNDESCAIAPRIKDGSQPKFFRSKRLTCRHAILSDLWGLRQKLARLEQQAQPLRRELKDNREALGEFPNKGVARGIPADRSFDRPAAKSRKLPGRRTLATSALMRIRLCLVSVSGDT